MQENLKPNINVITYAEFYENINNAYETEENMKHLSFKKQISLILIIALLTQIIPLPAAATIGSATNTLENQNPKVYMEDIYSNIDLQSLTDADILFENKELRSANSKSFYLTNGTMISAIYDSPVHEQDEEGVWQEINNKLNDNGDIYENQDASVKIKFYKNPKSGKLYTLKADDYQITWGLNGVNKSAKEASKQSKQADESQSKLTADSESELIRYKDIMPGITFDYQITGYGMKENIWLENSNTAKELSFSLKTNKLQVSKEDNKIIFRNDSGVVVYSMSAPYMMDADGISSDLITLELTGSKNHYSVTLIPDSEWLQNAAYPVMIDPILIKTLNYSEIDNTTITSNGYNNYQHGSITVGREITYGKCRGFFRFDLPDQMTSSDKVIQAQLYLTKAKLRENGSVTVNIHQMTKNLNFANAGWNDTVNSYSSTVIDSYSVPQGSSINDTFPVYFDITTAVRSWYQNGNNYGLAFVWDEENAGFDRYVTFNSVYNSSVPNSYKPAIIIQYANYNGIEDTLTYHTSGNGNMGTVSVSDYTGNMVYPLKMYLRQEIIFLFRFLISLIIQGVMHTDITAAESSLV